MIEKSLLLFWGVWLLLILVAAFRVFGFSIARRRQDRLWRDGSGAQKPVALIVPVKGFDLQSTPRFFDAIFGQTYRDYRVIVCFESWEDPVALWLCEHLELNPQHPVWTHPDPTNGLRGVTLVCSGLAEDEGQKVHNQRAAFEDLWARDAIVAFADADILCGNDWLARLVAPINRGTHELATTYRWLVPKRPTLPNQLASIINASITTQGGSEWCTVLWGGSMALTREWFDKLDVPNLLAGSLNDDLRLSKAARAKGKKIAFVRSLILPTPIDFNWRTFFEFVRRQYTQVKIFSPILYTGVNFVLGFYVLGAASIVAALVYGYFFAWIPVAAAYVIDQFRALARQQIYLSLFPDNGIRQKLFAASWLEHMLTPFWITLHWILLASTWTQNRLTWAGIRYRILSKSKTQVLHRAESTATLPAGAPGLAMIGALNDLRRSSATQPIRPDSLSTEPSGTYTVADAAPEIAITEVVSARAAVVAAVVDTTPICHPGGPSAVLPLTTSFYERPDRTHERITARERGCLSAIEVALQKTRLVPAVLFACPPPKVPTAKPASAPRPVPPPSPGALPWRPLTAAEKSVRKTRVGGKTDAAKVTTPRGHASPLPAPQARIKAKTRLPSVEKSAAPARISRPSVTVETTAALLDFFPTPSLAARRAGPGGPFRLHGLRFSPPLSSRPVPAGRPVGSVFARPVSRGPSARP